ncbi:hypothetical protein [Cecembia calidifontis]|jgi:hypothetical protein|uniref:Acetyltransferase (GNAT) family protein n=1 Tax=Cecembia calidifontis TaxID=1187080 RepID=A0A4Q7PH88_9BACT|nr:hypothetical protein [Cecembia calidifontis]RZS98272.1 hypothetical protein BC751_3914 [Cecembia calidifontis]
MKRHLILHRLDLNIDVRKYEERYREQWEAFIDHSANGTFLHKRSFLEYHGDRFEDVSVMVWEGEELLAVFPAHQVGNQIFSHKGLSFGGWIFKKDLSSFSQTQIINSILEFYKNQEIKSLRVAPVPYYYGQEKGLNSLDYDSLGFEISDNKEVYLIEAPFVLKDKGKKKGVRRAVRKGLEVMEGEVSQVFWEKLMLPMYAAKIGKAPVHSWKEIALLSERHPGRIQLISAFLGEELLAGIVIFRHPRVIKVQYSAVTEKGKISRAMDLLMHYLMNLPNIHYIDLGTVYDGQTGKKLESLAYWKESFGAKTYFSFIYEFSFH